MVTFRLAVDLLVADRCNLEQLTTCAVQIASTSRTLFQTHGVTVCISLCSSPESDINPMILQHLAPCLHGIDLYSVPAEQFPAFDPSRMRHSAFAHAHITALESCSTSFTSLCISDRNIGSEHHTTSLASSLPAIAQLGSLTKLHLSLMYCSTPASDLQPLSQLSSLEDLALQCGGGTASSPGVLLSCRLSLQTITLAASCWSLATYSALSQVPLLDRLVIKLAKFDAAQPLGISLLRAKHIKLELLNFQRIDAVALSAWASLSGVMQVHALTIWTTRDIAICLLTPMPALSVVTFARPYGFTGTTLPCQPSVTELRLIDCRYVHTEGLKRMLSAVFPALRTLAIQASMNTPCLHMTQQTLEALVCGRNLELIDLRGVQGITCRKLGQLHSLFMRKATLGKAQSSVTLQLPCDKRGQHQRVIYARNSLYCPALQLRPGHDKCQQVQTKTHPGATFALHAAVQLCGLHLACRCINKVMLAHQDYIVKSVF